MKAYSIGKYFVLCRLEQPRKNKNLLYRHDKPNEPTKKGPLSFVLSESHSPQFRSQQGPPLSSLAAWDQVKENPGLAVGCDQGKASRLDKET
jgi:hypothetical protein